MKLCKDCAHFSVERDAKDHRLDRCLHDSATVINPVFGDTIYVRTALENRMGAISSGFEKQACGIYAHYFEEGS